VHSHPVPHPPRPDPGAAPLRILALEDNDEDYQTLRRFLTPLTPLGNRTVWATTVADAMPLLANEVFDVCLVDLHLPDGHGLQVVQWLTDERPEVATVVMTADEHPDTDALALVAGADFFLAKSEWSSATLLRAVRYAVAHRRRLQEARVSAAHAAGQDDPIPICMDCKQIGMITTTGTRWKNSSNCTSAWSSPTGSAPRATKSAWPKCNNSRRRKTTDRRISVSAYRP
jgi:CheY-like chemotaxis protein